MAEEPKGPPSPPPVLPPTINEDVFAPKRKMQAVKAAAGKRVKKYHRKFQKIIRKFLKKQGEKERYCPFYDLGYRYEAVFCELTMDGMDFLGTPLHADKSTALLAELKKELRLPEGEDAILLETETDENGEVTVIKLIATAEFKEIERLRLQVENAPRRGNPGQ